MASREHESSINRIAVDSRYFLQSILDVIRIVVVFYIGFTIVITLIVFGNELKIVQSMLMVFFALSCLVWTAIKSQSLIYTKLWFPKDNVDAHHNKRLTMFFVIQLASAAAAIFVTERTQAALLLWLLLLPSTLHATILLPRWGLVLVLCLCELIDGLAIMVAFGAQALPVSLAQCGLGLGIVVVLTELIIRAVRSRLESLTLSEELRFANVRLREYALQAEEYAAVRERNRLAREIHDTIGHALTIANVQLEVAAALFDQNPPVARDAIHKSQFMVQEGLREIRASVGELRSSPLDQQSLDKALQRVVSEVTTPQCEVAFEVWGQTRKLEQKAHLCLFRTTQECMTNAKRHSSATKIELILDYRDPDSVVLSVRDNGNGVADIQEGFGIIGIRERAQDIGGCITIETAVGKGFVLEVRVPG
jgi:signal transduction histidine kinase